MRKQALIKALTLRAARRPWHEIAAETRIKSRTIFRMVDEFKVRHGIRQLSHQNIMDGISAECVGVSIAEIRVANRYRDEPLHFLTCATN